MTASALDELNIDLDLWTAMTGNDRLAAILTALSMPQPPAALAAVTAITGAEAVVSILASYFAGVYQRRNSSGH